MKIFPTSFLRLLSRSCRSDFEFGRMEFGFDWLKFGFGVLREGRVFFRVVGGVAFEEL